MKIKYSVVLPVHNGKDTLSLTIPEMLSIDRDDFEIVISENHSTDSTNEFLNSISDNRLKVFKPPKRLPIGDNLEYAYSKAIGDWQGHLGDDDMLYPFRFEIFDFVINKYPSVSLIRGENIRYTWHNFPNRNLANTLNPGKSFSGKIKIKKGVEVAKTSMNSKSVHGGGSWLVKKSIISNVKKKAGFFSHTQNLEFFSMRASCILSPKVALIDFPIYIMGRHNTSSASQAIENKKKVSRSWWNWEKEDNKNYEYCPYQYKGYAPYSMDGALRTMELFSSELEGFRLDEVKWLSIIYEDINKMIRNSRLEKGSLENFFDILSNYNIRLKLKFYIYQYYRTLRSIFAKSKMLKQIINKNKKSIFQYDSNTICSEYFKSNNIIQLANEIDKLSKDLLSELTCNQ